jgi:dynein heavy chain
VCAQSHFSLIHTCFPGDAQIRRIFDTLLTEHFSGFDEEIKGLAEVTSQATLELYKQVAEEFLPTPSRPHYVFNMRDMGRVLQGVLLSDPKFFDTRDGMIRLWVHGACGVVAQPAHVPRPTAAVQRCCASSTTASSTATIECASCAPLTPSSIRSLRSAGASSSTTRTSPACHSLALSSTVPPPLPPPPATRVPTSVHRADADEKSQTMAYQEITDEKEARARLQERLERYNADPENSLMDLVLFRKAVDHVARVYRVLTQPRGHVMCIGVGGSGRQVRSARLPGPRALTRLARRALCGWRRTWPT